MKLQNGLQSLIVMLATIHFCCPRQNVTEVASRRKRIEKRAIEGYRDACLKLQELTFWTSALFKIKSVWASSTANQIAQNYQLRSSVATSNISMPTRPKREGSGSECSTMKNVYVIAQNYVYLQIQVLRIKAVFGNRLLQTSRLKLNDSSIALKEGMKSLDALTALSRDLFNKLKLGIQTLSSNAEHQVSKPLSEIQELGSFVERSQNLEKVESFSRAGSFFENLGRTLDSFLFPQKIESPLAILNSSATDSFNNITGL